jgi:hypothetical protein
MAGRRHLCNDATGIGVNRPGAFAEFIAPSLVTRDAARYRTYIPKVALITP